MANEIYKLVGGANNKLRGGGAVYFSYATVAYYVSYKFCAI